MLGVYETNYGLDDPDTMFFLNTLAIVEIYLKNFIEAKALYEKALHVNNYLYNIKHNIVHIVVY